MLLVAYIKMKTHFANPSLSTRKFLAVSLSNIREI